MKIIAYVLLFPAGLGGAIFIFSIAASIVGIKDAWQGLLLGVLMMVGFSAPYLWMQTEKDNK